MFGYTGHILHVNLSTGVLEVEKPSEKFYRKYVGGSALGLYYLLKMTPAGADPFGPENTLIFSISAITGAPISGQSRVNVTAKSPLTGAVGDSQAGGFFPAEMKFAGFDAIVIRGIAESPVYLWIRDGQVELRDAAHIWGHQTLETEVILKNELGDDKIEIAQIGPAGENLIRFASIMNMGNRANGRTGMGAVMGSKRLKAIVVRGTSRRLSIADEEGLHGLAKTLVYSLRKDGEIAGLSRFGTSEQVPMQNLVGGLPTRNWQSGTMGVEKADAISGETMFNSILCGSAENRQNQKGRDTCYSCAIQCKRVVDAEWRGQPIRPESGGPEYETISAFGSYCDIDDLKAIALANQLCNQYGVDTISAGATMAFAIECFESGILTNQDTDGIELRWGNAEGMIAMLKKTLKREGLGNVFAEGSARAARLIGKGSEKYVMAVKNQELPAHMPHVKRSLALIYAVNPFGADHQSHEHDTSYDPDIFSANYNKYGKRLSSLGLSDPQDPRVLNQEKVRFSLVTGYSYSALDSVNVCQFVYGPGCQLQGMGELAEIISAVTGWDMTIDELQALGARRLNMMRAFNARDGYNRASDNLPERMFVQPLSGGASNGISIDRTEFEDALNEYYHQAGWDDQTGNPTSETLEKHGLGWIRDV